MSDEYTNRDRIEDALDQLELAMATLQRDAKPCDTCGLHVQTNRSEAQAYLTISSARGKLMKVLEHEALQSWLDRENKGTVAR